MNSQRKFLRKYQILDEEPVVLGLLDKRKPETFIRERILNSAYQTYVDTKESLFVVGSLKIDRNSEGLSLEINAIRGRPQPGCDADFMAGCRFCRAVEARDPNDTVVNLVEDIKTKQYSSSGFSVKSLVDYFSVDIHAKLDGPNCTLDISLVCFERRLTAHRIKGLTITTNSVFKLVHQTQRDILWGWVYSTKGTAQLALKDDLRQDCLGVWVAGTATILHPVVWLVCQHFLNSVERSDIFVCAHLNDSMDFDCYSVSPLDNTMRSVVLSGIEKTTVTRVFSAKDRLIRVPMTLCFIDDGDFTMDATRNVTNTMFRSLCRENTAERTEESYELETRSGLPVLLSPRPANQFTPATVGVQKTLPKRISLSPELSSGPSDSSTPLQRVLPERRSFPGDQSRPPESPVSPEILQLIRKQELEISLLKEQIQLLMQRQATPVPERPVECPEKEERIRLSPPPVLAPLENFVPLKPYCPETIIEGAMYARLPNQSNDRGVADRVNLDDYPDREPGDGQRAVIVDDNRSGSLIATRLQYEPLILSGAQPQSIFVNEVTRKYFGKSPQVPTLNKLVGKTPPQVGMLRRVLTSEASKQLNDENDETPRRFLDVDALRRQPKFL